ncbi:hypothetical protein ACQV2T_04290 [Facklamia sp. P13069]|uniref:hypothetical protein n=2 Tax=Facklamia TaxID=66831 RepID=UPI003D16FF1D
MKNSTELAKTFAKSNLGTEALSHITPDVINATKSFANGISSISDLGNTKKIESEVRKWI